MADNNKFVLDIPMDSSAEKALAMMNSGSTVFEDSTRIFPVMISGAPTNLRGYVPWGDDNQRPYDVTELRRKDEVMSTNIFFNILTGYGLGVTYKKPDGSKVDHSDIKRFFRYHRSVRYMMEQQTDMKHYYFTISILILSGDGQKIVKLKHLDACNVRLESCNPDTGVIEHIFYGDFRNNKPRFEHLDVYELLDPTDPLGDLEVRMGRLPNEKGLMNEPSSTRMFAMMNYIPIPGNQYYPFPYNWSVFNSGWYDIKQLIAEGKKTKFKNGLVVKYQVEILDKYWQKLYESEGISEPDKKKERKLQEHENIKQFLTGMQNAGKVMITGKYVDPNGKEQSMITFNVINPNKEGGDWLEDTEEASNMECYADAMPPSLVGATPGKSKATFSGTDKRETFTMKQALEVPIRHILLEPYYVIINYNGWEDDVEIDIPFMQLTTLDKGTDAQPVHPDPNNPNN